MWVEKNIGLEWQEAITKSSVQLDHGKLTPEIKTGRCYSILISPGPKICSCNLVIDWVLHLGFAVSEPLMENLGHFVR